MIIYEPGKELLKQPRPDHLFLVEPYIPRGSIVMLFGRPTLGKTPMCWQFAQAVQTGQPIWGLPVSQANVLFLELDMPQLLAHDRWDDADPKFEPEFVVVFDNQSIDCLQFLSPYPDERHRVIGDELRRMHRKYEFGLVCIDALREVVVSDLNTGGTPRRIYDAFKSVFPGAAIMFIHHEKKVQVGNYGKPDPMHLASGSMEFINVAQVAIQLHKSGRQTYLMHHKTQASEIYPPLPLTIAADGVHFTDPNAERREKVLSIIRAAPSGTGNREIDALVGKELGISARTARTIRRGLIQAGDLSETTPNIVL